MSRQFEKTSANLIAGKVPPAVLSPEFSFSIEQQRRLLRIAHQAILCVLECQPFSEAAPFPTELAHPRGVFTTLYLHGQLRGCVGYAMPVAPLYRAVAETACAAAFEDSRFVPVTKAEGLELQISLSVLSLLFAVRPEMVEVGRHGLVISQGARRGSCCRKFRSNMVGTGRSFWSRPVARQGSRGMRGARVPVSPRLRRWCLEMRRSKVRLDLFRQTKRKREIDLPSFPD